MKKISTFQTKDVATHKWAGEVRDVVGAIQDKALLGGVLVTDVSLAQATTTFVQHGMPRKARGWILVENNKAIAGLRRVKTSEVRNEHIALYADTVTSGPATISVWVF